MPTYDRRHGGPYDRGSADRYYGRGMNPHYFKGATYMSEEVKASDMTKEEINAYIAGYVEEEDRKDWGFDPPETDEPDDDEDLEEDDED